MTRSLPRKSEKSVKIGNKRLGIALQRTPNMGGHLGGLRREHLGKHSPPASLLASVSPRRGAMGPLGLGPTPKGSTLGHRGTRKNRGTPIGGGEYSREKARQRVGPPHGPPPNLRVFILGVFASKFADILGLIACKLIALFLYSSM